MTNSDVIKLLIAEIKTGIELLGYGNEVVIRQSYQPAKTSVPDKITIYIHKIYTHFYGNVRSRYDISEINDGFDNKILRWYIDMYQIDALGSITSRNDTLYTPHDMLSDLLNYFNSDTVLQRFSESDLFLDQLSHLRQGYFVDDRDLYEMNPSFDLSFTYQNEITIGETPKIAAFEADIYRV